MPIKPDIDDSIEDDMEPVPDWHLTILKERLSNIADAVFVNTEDFIQSLKVKSR